MSLVERTELNEGVVLREFVRLIDGRDYSCAYNYYTKVINDNMRDYLGSHPDGKWRVEVIKRRKGGRF